MTPRTPLCKLAPSELERVEREITATDSEIDELVYELYGITEEERKIIEHSGATGVMTQNSCQACYLYRKLDRTTNWRTTVS